MFPSQLLKGVLEGVILSKIEKQETYAYEISKLLEHDGFGEISEGTIYPILLRLQKANRIAYTSRPSPTGPMRKYYHLTDTGREQLAQFKDDWVRLTKAMDNILNTNKEMNDE